MSSYDIAMTLKLVRFRRHQPGQAQKAPTCCENSDDDDDDDELSWLGPEDFHQGK